MTISTGHEFYDQWQSQSLISRTACPRPSAAQTFLRSRGQGGRSRPPLGPLQHLRLMTGRAAHLSVVRHRMPRFVRCLKAFVVRHRMPCFESCLKGSLQIKHLSVPVQQGRRQKLLQHKGCPAICVGSRPSRAKPVGASGLQPHRATQLSKSLQWVPADSLVASAIQDRAREACARHDGPTSLELGPRPQTGNRRRRRRRGGDRRISRIGLSHLSALRRDLRAEHAAGLTAHTCVLVFGSSKFLGRDELGHGPQPCHGGAH